MPERKKNFAEMAAIGAPTVAGLGVAAKALYGKGIFNMPKTPQASAFISRAQQAGLSINQGIDLAFFGENQLLFKSQPEIARNAWIQAVQTTDPLASETLSFGGDFKSMPANKVVSSIEQNLQRNNSVFMARIYNKFKSNTKALRKHFELTGKVPSFQKVEGLTFAPPTNVAINKLPTEIQGFHQSMVEAGFTGRGAELYSRPGWEGFGTYRMSYKRAGMATLNVNIPISKGGTLIEGLTQSARRVAPDVGIFDPRTGGVKQLSAHEFYLRDIQQSILPRVTSGDLKTGWDVEKAFKQSYEKYIYGLESIPNPPEGQLSGAWKSYAKIKGGAGVRFVTEGELGNLRPGELYKSVFNPVTENQYKTIMGQGGLYPLASPKNIAGGMASTYNAAEWSPFPEAVDWGRQPRQALRQWRAARGSVGMTETGKRFVENSAVAEMFRSGSSKWSIFETQAWRGGFAGEGAFGNYAAPWIPTVYVDPKRHGQLLEHLGMKDGESLIADVFNKERMVEGQMPNIHMGFLTPGVKERIESGAAFEVGEILGQTPEGANVTYKKGMKILGLEKFDTTARGQELALKYKMTLKPEIAGKYFKDMKAVVKQTSTLPLQAGLMGRADIEKLQGRFQLVASDELAKDTAKLNMQISTGLWRKLSREKTSKLYAHNQRLAAFIRNPRVYSSFMHKKYGQEGFIKKMMELAVKDARLTPEEFGTFFGMLDPEKYAGVVPKRYLQEITGISLGQSQAIFHNPMELTGAGAMGSVEPRMFNILGGGQFGELGAGMYRDMQTRLAATNPRKFAAYEGLTKTLASFEGMVKPSGEAIWDVAQRGYQKEGFQTFIEGGGGWLKTGTGKNIFVPGGDVLTPYTTAKGELIGGDLASEYHRITGNLSRLHAETTAGKRLNLQAADEALNGFISNIMKQQAPFGEGAGAIGRGQLLGSRFLRSVTDFKGMRPSHVAQVLIPMEQAEEMMSEIAEAYGSTESVKRMNDRLLAGKEIGGMMWRHPLAGQYSAVPIGIRAMEGITEPVAAVASKMVDIGMKSPIELGPAIGMGLDFDADIPAVSFVNPELEGQIRQKWIGKDTEFTRAYTEHQVRAQIIKTKAAGGASALAAQEKMIADAMKLGTGQRYIGKLSTQFSAASQAATQRISGQQAANVSFTLGWLEESILKAKHLPGEKVLSGEFSSLLETVESSFQAGKVDPELGAQRLEGVIRNMLERDETSRQLLEAEYRIPKNIEAVREATGVKSLRQTLPSINLKETTRDIMNAHQWAETSGLAEMAQTAAGRRAKPSMLGKYMAYTGSVMSQSKGVFSNVMAKVMESKNFAASMGMGMLEHAKPIGWGLAGTLAIATALSKPQSLTGSGSEYVPTAKALSKPPGGASKMRPEDVLPPTQPLGEPTAPPMMTVPSVRILPAAERRDITVKASSSRTNVEDMVNRYKQRTRPNRINVNVRDSTSRLNSHNIADRILR